MASSKAEAELHKVQSEVAELVPWSNLWATFGVFFSGWHPVGVFVSPALKRWNWLSLVWLKSIADNPMFLGYECKLMDVYGFWIAVFECLLWLVVFFQNQGSMANHEQWPCSDFARSWDFNITKWPVDWLTGFHITDETPWKPYLFNIYIYTFKKSIFLFL